MNLKLFLTDSTSNSLTAISFIRKLRILLPILLIGLWNIGTISGANETIPAGSYIIDMGVTPQTVGNGLKPYGLIYALIKNYRVPVKWVINPTKYKDGVDFTHNGYDFKGAPFIISAEFRTPAVNTLISLWEAKGVQGRTISSSVTVFVYATITNYMTWTLDAKNGKIAEEFLESAEMPLTSYQFKDPALLDCCNDLYVMPHADPTWETHKNLLYWNNSAANNGCRGAIYASCHAVSVWENTFNPANPTERMNFLMNDPISPSTQSAVLFGDHDKGTPPYNYDFHTHPVMQFMGSMDEATQNGSEQIFLPYANGWRKETMIGVWDPTQKDIPTVSPGKAATVAFGPGKGDASRGRVMYEGGHDVGKSSDPQFIAAQRAFFNFAYWASEIKAIHLTNTIPTKMVSTKPYNVSVVASGGAGGYVYKWTSTCGGTFSNPNAASTTFTPPSVLDTTTCIVSCEVTDACGSRTTFVSIKVDIDPKEVCQDLTDGGQIGVDQSNCGAFDPTLLTNVTNPTGGSGTLEYQWYSNNALVPVTDASWKLISGANNESYDPPLTPTSMYFIRKARRSGCNTFLNASNIARITVNSNCSACTCQRQLLYNTDFESGTATGWKTGIVGQAGTASVYIYTGGPTGRYAALNYTDAIGNFFIEQIWNNVIPGRTYVFSADIARHSGTNAYIRAEFYNAANQLLSQSADRYATTQFPTFVPFSFNLVAPPGASYVRIVGFANKTALKMDNVKLVTCFEPIISFANINDANICSGGSATLNAVLSDPSVTVAYQWQASTDGKSWSNIPTSTGSSLTILPTISTYYRVNATPTLGSCSTVSSNAVSVTVHQKPTVTTIANDAEICTGGATSLIADIINGSGSTTYQWQSSNDNVSFNNILNETNAVLNVANLTTTTYYKVNITQSGNGCSSASSTTATKITVKPTPSVNVSASDAEICTGGATFLTAEVINGSGSTTYQWQSSTDNVSFSNILNETNAVLNVANLTATTYYKVNITQSGNGCGSASSTTSTKITVKPIPSVNVSASDAEICTGGATTLTANVINGSGSTIYQWQESTDNVSFSNIINETNAVLNLTNLTTTTYYKVNITQSGNGCGSASSTTSTKITVKPIPSVNVSASDAEICTGGATTLTANVINGSGSTIYQWQESTDNVSFSHIINETNAVLNLTNLTTTTYYKVNITQSGNGCGSASSTIFTKITVKPTPSVNVSASDATICSGYASVLSATVTNGTGSTTYQWQSSSDGQSFIHIPDETASSLTATALTQSMYYRIIISQTGNGCGTINSAKTLVNVTDYPTAEAGNDQSQCTNVFTMAANIPSVGMGTWTIVNGTVTIANINSPTTTVTVTSSTAILRWTVSVNSTCEEFDDVLLNLANQLIISSNPMTIDECVDGNRAMGVNVSGGTGFQNFQWQKSTNNVTWADIIDETNSSFVPQSLTAGTNYYRVVITPAGAGCNTVTSVSARVRIFEKPTITITANDGTVCAGNGTIFSATVSDGTGSIVYQWQSSSDGINFINIVGATNVIFNTPALTTTTHYRLQITQSGSGCGTVTSATTIIQVTSDPIANAGVDQNQCSNIFKMTANTPSVGTGLWTVLDGEAVIETPDSPTSNVILTSSTATLRWTNKVNNMCSNADEVVLSIAQPLSIIAQPTDIKECVGGILTLTAAVTGGAGTLTYVWQSSTDNISWQDIDGANEIVYTPSSVASGMVYYRLKIRSSAMMGCSETFSNSASVTIIDKPNVKVSAKSTMVCAGGGIQLDATIHGGVDCTVQWQNSINGGAVWNDIQGATSNSFTTSTLSQTTKYRVTISCNGNGCCN